ncbi:MAG TPA: hypothetical protein VE954_05030 [Oligoflexus sp.]|uniref:hypothetical protein n=1 Tax=Oligoflexus sp. TaxID=1971216 RepID=UPI002D4B94ED|nr:hypothetical protein [Oligoflexus sp.]HYX32455.1 hypothetical protein [Oligoflexus sp.]
MTFRLFQIVSLVSLLSTMMASGLALAQGQVRIVVSVDWEGRELQSRNLQAMQKFRKDYPEIPLQHFLNAAYYTKPGAVPSQITQTVRSVLRPGDEEGLHVHAWRSLVRASGVAFRTGPSFVEGEVDLRTCTVDCGHDVALTAYTQTELQKVLRYSVSTLQKQGFARATSFRAGGWQANSKVLRALAAEGFRVDSSATYAEYLFESWGDANLYSFVGKLWPQSQPTSQPYRINLGSGLNIVELPNNGCLADYMDAEAISTAFIRNVELLKQQPDRDVYLSIGFHQETAATYLPNLRGGIDQIIAYAKANNIQYTFEIPNF